MDRFGVSAQLRLPRGQLGVSAPPRLETPDGSVPRGAGGDHRFCQSAGSAQGGVQCLQLPAVAARHRPALLRRDRAPVRPGVGQHAGGPRRLQVQRQRAGIPAVRLLQRHQQQQLLLLSQVTEYPTVRS